MHVLKVRNVHAALPEGIDLLCRLGYERDSRYGKVIRIDEPVTIRYRNPWERVSLWTERDANPFFHLAEAIWMLAGRDDVYFVKQFAARMEEFSDDRKTLHGAYGRRWRSWFKIDQLKVIIETLKSNPDDRRCVLQMWDCTKDLARTGNDVPCNVVAMFSVNQDKQLDMTVCQRSGDMIWGVLGANAVHMSVLQEYMATGIGVPIGRYWQVVNNFHAYLTVFSPLAILAERARDPYTTDFNPYGIENIESTKVVDTPLKEWDEDLAMWLNDPLKVGIRSAFFKRTATPMIIAHRTHKAGNTEEAIEIIKTQMNPKSDWAVASKEWLIRRLKK